MKIYILYKTVFTGEINDLILTKGVFSSEKLAEEAINSLKNIFNKNLEFLYEKYYKELDPDKQLNGWLKGIKSLKDRLRVRKEKSEQKKINSMIAFLENKISNKGFTIPIKYNEWKEIYNPADFNEKDFFIEEAELNTII